MLLERFEPPLYPSVNIPKVQAQRHWPPKEIEVGWEYFPHVLVLDFVQRERGCGA